MIKGATQPAGACRRVSRYRQRVYLRKAYRNSTVFEAYQDWCWRRICRRNFDGPQLRELLSDPDRSIAARYGVKRPGPLSNRRKTFVIGADQRVIEVIGSEFDMNSHADAALDAVRNAIDPG
jgi:hypothetical protein